MLTNQTKIIDVWIEKCSLIGAVQWYVVKLITQDILQKFNNGISSS